MNDIVGSDESRQGLGMKVKSVFEVVMLETERARRWGADDVSFHMHGGAARNG